MDIRKNDIVKLEITDMSSEGSGIGRYEGKVVFVPMTAPGDVINAKIVKVEKKMCYGIIDSIIDPSDIRVNPDCSVYSQCGGCVYRHISYESELAIKEKRVLDALERIGGIKEFVHESIVGCSSRCGYRNKHVE
jgi:23S rRNA (uracil1939-C5)-methyltransferase